MAALEAIMEGARTHLRDQPRFFEATVAKNDIARTFRLPHPNVRPGGMYVAATNNQSTTVASVVNKVLIANVATLTTAYPHGFSPGMTVTVAITDAIYDGTFVITAVASPTTFSYAVTHIDVISTAVSPAGTASVPVVPVLGVHAGQGISASATVFTYVLDEREGLLRIVEEITTAGGLNGYIINLEGYYLEWVCDADLRYFTNNIIAEHAYRRTDFDIDSIDDVEEDCIAMGAACEVMWSLLAETARDIDINTPEAIGIQATQRFHQIEDILFSPRGLLEKYKTKANMIGVGLERIEIFTLRRVSRTTDRLVPVYRQREWDDARPRQRVFPPVDAQAPSSPPPSFKIAAYVPGIDAGPGV